MVSTGQKKKIIRIAKNQVDQDVKKAINDATKRGGPMKRHRKKKHQQHKKKDHKKSGV